MTNEDYIQRLCQPGVSPYGYCAVCDDGAIVKDVLRGDYYCDDHIPTTPVGAVRVVPIPPDWKAIGHPTPPWRIVEVFDGDEWSVHGWPKNNRYFRDATDAFNYAVELSNDAR